MRTACAILIILPILHAAARAIDESSSPDNPRPDSAEATEIVALCSGEQPLARRRPDERPDQDVEAVQSWSAANQHCLNATFALVDRILVAPPTARAPRVRLRI